MSGSVRSISFVVVAYNEGRHVARLKRSIDALRRAPDTRMQTILVDGGSRDQTVAEARRAGFDVVIELPGANIPVCRNRGLREATGNWVAFVDGDCELAPDWLEKAGALLDHEPLLLAGWPAQPPEPLTWVQDAWRFHWLQKNRATEDRHGQAVIAREGFRLATTRNMVFHRAVADRVGGFNESLDTGEDTDFAFRADQAGVAVWGVPGLLVHHHGEPATLGAWFRQQLWHANRKSYRHILKLSGGRVGGNAPMFTALYLGTLLLGLLGLAGALFTGHGSPIALLAPWLAVVAGPAVLLCARGRSFRHLPALCVLYAAYGLARSIDLLGLHRAKRSWKSGSSRQAAPATSR